MRRLYALITFLSLSLTACGGGGGGVVDTDPEPLTVAVTQIAWPPAPKGLVALGIGLSTGDGAPVDLVLEVSKAESRGLAAWKDAFKTNRWQQFAKQLAVLVRLKRRVADAIGYQNVPYDALLDVYEPGATVKQLDPLLQEVKEATIPLVKKIVSSKRRPDSRILRQEFEAAKQLEFARSVVRDAQSAIDDGRDDVALVASAAKARCSDVASLIAGEGIQMHGGIGMTDEEELGLLAKRLKTAEATLGDAIHPRSRFASLRGY